MITFSLFYGIKLLIYSTYNHWKVGLESNNYNQVEKFGWWVSLCLPTLKRYESGKFYIGKFIIQLRKDNMKGL